MKVRVLKDPAYGLFTIGRIYPAHRAENDHGYMVQLDDGRWLFLFDREVEVASPRVERRRCDCHPETCACRPYVVMAGDEELGTYVSRERAEEAVALLQEIVG